MLEIGCANFHPSSSNNGSWGIKMVRHKSKWTTFLCKVNFSRQIFLLYFGKGNFGGKKIYFEKEVFPIKIS
jgi:hypothetical protein